MSLEPIFLTAEDVYAIHRDGIEEHGGSHGVRDHGLVESAVAAPQNLFAYEAADPHELAAAYLFSLCKNHPFVDGNKRVALRAADVFLMVNGFDLAMSDSEAYDLTVGVATGSATRDEVAEAIRAKLKPLR